jgi:hypothetical protein
MQNLLKELERIRLAYLYGLEHASLDADFAQSLQDEFADGKLLADATKALESGDQQSCQRNCETLIKGLGCNLLIRSQARMLLTKVDSISREERREYPQRTLSVLEGLVFPDDLKAKRDELIAETKAAVARLEVDEVVEMLIDLRRC